MEAVQAHPLEDREAFKYALGATLVKNNAHWRAFETVFEVYFSLRGPSTARDGDESDDLDEMWTRDAGADAPGRGRRARRRGRWTRSRPRSSPRCCTRRCS
jgi:uncharacterized protein